MTNKFSTSDILNLDKQIEQLMDCKLLSEAEVKALCDKVNLIFKNLHSLYLLGKRNSFRGIKCSAST